MTESFPPRPDFFSGERIAQLAETHGTPLFVYDSRILRHQYAVLTAALPEGAAIHFSVKANPAPRMIRQFLDLGAGVEIASAGEYHFARRAGAAPEKILFAGPGKSAEELEYVLTNGIGQVHVETREEIDTLLELTEKLDVEVQVAVRVNPSKSAGGGAMRMGGLPSAFGFGQEDLPELLPWLDSLPRLNLVGLHQFAGTQVLDAGTLLTQWQHAFQQAADFEQLLGRAPEVVDVGGGLGIPLYQGETDLDIEEVSRGLSGIGSPPEGCQMVVEPGRFLAGPCGGYVCRIRAVKRSRGQLFLITDGGMHHHLAASGNLGQVIKRDFPVDVIGRNCDADEGETAMVCGPLCTPLDVLARKVQVKDPQVGDLVVVRQSGAYGISASPSGFLSHPMPAEVLVHEDGSEEMVRERGTVENLHSSYLD